MKRIPLSFFVIGVMLFAYNSYGQTMQLGGGMPPDAPGSKFLNTVNAPAEPAKPASNNENTPSFYEITTSVVAPYKSPLMTPLYKLDNPDQGFKVNVSKW